MFRARTRRSTGLARIARWAWFVQCSVPLASENRGLPGGLFSLLLRFPLHTVVERGACVFWDAQTQAASPCAHYWCFRAWSDKIASSGRWTF